jgi:hypothetical protein
MPSDSCDSLGNVYYYDYDNSAPSYSNLIQVRDALSQDISLNFNNHDHSITGLALNSGVSRNILLPSSSYRVNFPIVTPGSCTGSWKRSLSVNNQSSDQNIKIYPNPSTTDFTVEFLSNTNEGHIQIWDMTGKKVLDEACSMAKPYIIHASFWHSGAYHVRVTATDGKVFDNTVLKLN